MNGTGREWGELSQKGDLDEKHLKFDEKKGEIDKTWYIIKIKYEKNLRYYDEKKYEKMMNTENYDRK